jgi:hypothetical protein
MEQGKGKKQILIGQSFGSQQVKIISWTVLTLALQKKLLMGKHYCVCELHKNARGPLKISDKV